MGLALFVVGKTMRLRSEHQLTINDEGIAMMPVMEFHPQEQKARPYPFLSPVGGRSAGRDCQPNTRAEAKVIGMATLGKCRTQNS